MKTKFKLWQMFGTTRGLITEDILRSAIKGTGLSEKSRGIKAVIAYMRDYRHLGEEDGHYYVIYRRKDEANPRDFVRRLLWQR